jgi:hypothetical protein
VKRCRVAFRDSDGVEHAVEVEARTLYEAVGLAIDRFRRCEHVPYEPKGMHEFIVESRESALNVGSPGLRLTHGCAGRGDRLLT